MLQTRGLLVLDVQVAPPDPKGWFRWLLEVPEGTDGEVVYYIDGSVVDGPDRLTARAGLAIVAIVGRAVVGYAVGAPPAWATTSAAAEGWALLMVVKASVNPPRVVTDCLGLLDTLERGQEAATGAGRVLARLWALLFSAFDGKPPDGYVHTDLCWMGSHGSRAVIGVARRSDGKLVSQTDWRANRLVDAFARQAAERKRLPKSTRDLLRVAGEAVRHQAAVLGMVTHAASNFLVSATRPDGSYYRARLRDACPPAFENTRGRAQRRGTRGQAGHRNATGKERFRPQDTLPPTRPPAQPGEGPSSANWHSTRTARAKRARDDLADAAEARFYAAWAEERLAKARPLPAPGLTATERLEALRRRVAQKTAAS